MEWLARCRVIARVSLSLLRPNPVAAALMVAVLGSLVFSLPLGSGPAAHAADQVARTELPGLRTEVSKTYRNGDGSFTTALFDVPVHYEGQAGRWAEISSKLVPAGESGFAWRNEANRFGVFFKSSAAGEFLRIDAGGHSYSLALEEPAASVGTTRRSVPSQISYDAIAPGADLRYRILPTGLEETLVLSRADAPSHYRFRLFGEAKAPLRAVRLPDRSWLIRRQASLKPLFVIPAPFARDAAGSVIDGGTPEGAEFLSLDVRAEGSELVLELELDEEWLKSPERRFPVTIDPTITIDPPVEDGIWFADEPTWSASSRRDRFEIGADDQHVKRAALKFDLSAVPSGADLTDAQLKVYFDNNCMGGCGVGHQLDVHLMTADWNRSSTTADLAFDPTPLNDYTVPAWDPPQWMSWDITSAVDDWLSATEPNYGLLLKRDTEALNSGGLMPPASQFEEPTLRPMLEVSYDDVGVELLEPDSLHSNGAELAWTEWDPPVVDPFEEYKVHRASNAGFTPSASTLLATITDEDITSYRDTTAAPEEAFTYKIVANGIESNPRTVTLPADGESSKALKMRPEQGDAAFLEYIDGTISCDNTGAFDSLYVGTWGDAIYRPLLAFDLGDIPAEATVSDATLSLWVPWPHAFAADIEAHRVTSGWEEGTGEWTCDGDGATWHESAPGVEWSSEGGDFDATVVDSVAASGGWERWDEFDLTALAQEWISGETANQGVLLKLSDEELEDANFYYYSDDWAISPSLRPKLSVTYTDGSHAEGPAVSLSKPAPGAMVSGSAVALAAAASDDGRVDEVEFRVDGSVVDSDTSAPYEGEWDSTAVANGDHTLTARATDDAGNVTTSAGVTVSVGNSAAPSTSITAPTGGATVTGTTSITANASDDVAVTKVEFYVDDVRLGVDQSSPYSLSWNTLSTTLPAYDGARVLTTRAYDAHGHVTTSADVSVTVGNTTGTKFKGTFTSTAFPQTVVYDPAAGAQDEYGIDVTVTNQSGVTWNASTAFMRYRWLSPDPTPTVTDGGLVSLGSNLGSGNSRLVSLLVPPPTLPNGVSQARYRLRVDMFDDITDKFFAEKGNQPLELGVIVKKPLETDLGLERYYQYEGEALGGGMERMVNVASGNSLLRWTPFQAPGIGLSTVVDLTYNSLEKRSHSPVGNNFSLAVSSLVRFGSPLEIHPTSADTLAGRSDRYIEFTDGDGTTHRFEGALDGTEEYWEEPAGVHLYLREYPGSDPERAWALTRPDRVTFFFDEDGYPTYVEDGNGNELAFPLEAVPAGENPGGPTKRVTEVTDEGDRSFELHYYTAEEAPTAAIRGKVQRLTDHTGSALDFDYYEDGNLLRLTQRGGTNADGSFLPDRSFVFTYTTADGSAAAIPNAANRVNPDPATADQSTRLYSVADLRGNETLFTYCSATSCDSIAANQWKLATRTDREGNVTSYAYDPSTDLTTVTAPLSRETEYVNDGEGSVLEITNAKGETTELEWNTDRQLENVIEPTTEFTEFAYNDNGYLTSVTNQLGEETALAYENLPVDGNDVTGKWKAGRTIPHLSQLVEKTSPKGTMTPGDPDDFDWEFDYDGNGNLAEVVDAEGFVTAYTYNADGTLATTTDARGVATTGDPDDFVTEFLDYDENGFPTRIVDAEGGTARFGYDDDGLLRTIQDPRHAGASGPDTRSYQVTLDYDAFHRLGRQSEPKSTANDPGVLIWTGIAFDANDNVLAEYGPDDRSLETSVAKVETTYDAMDRPILVTADRNPSASGTEQTELAYDDAGRLTTVVLPKGVASTSVADDFTNEYVYDALDRVVTEIRYPDDGSSLNARRSHACYDLAGDLRWLTAPKAAEATAPTDCPSGTAPDFTRTFEYDAAHRLVEEVDALGREQSFAYNENGSLKTIVDADGNQTRYQFDELDRVNKIVEPFTTSPLREITTRLEYDPVGNLARFISPRAWDEAGGVFPFEDFVTAYNYDGLNRLVRTDLPTDGVETPQYVHNAYDANGNLSWTSLPVTASSPGSVAANKKTTFTYFDPGWIRTSNDPGNPLIRFDYWPEGWQRTRTDADGEVTSWRYFEDGLVQQINERAEGVHTFAYDRNGNLTRAVEDAGRAGAGHPSNVICVEYTGFDEIAKTRTRSFATDEWHFTTFAYDRNGNLTAREDNGTETSDGCDGPFTDPDPGREHTFTYDEADWVTQQVDEGLLAATTDDRRITTAFTDTGWEETRLIERYDGSAWQDKQTTNWTYFENSKLKTLETKNRAGNIVEDHTVSYIDGGIYMNGHRVEDEFKIQHPGTNSDCKSAFCTAAFEYDARDRLVSYANGHGETIDYELDTAGNVVLREETGEPDRTYTYQGDQLTTESEAGAGEDFEYFYDARGNLYCTTLLAGTEANCTAPAGGTISSNLVSLAGYDRLNRVNTYRTFGSGVEVDRTTYVYDALNRPFSQRERHGSTGPTRTKTFTYLGLSNLLSQEIHTNPGVTKTYSFDAFGHRIGMTDDPVSGPTKTYSYGNDVHGSVSVLLDDDQDALKASYGYDPYGKIDVTLTKGDVHPTDAEKPPEDPLNPYRYTGKRLDSGSGSYDMGARRFAAGAGRFLQQDLYLGALANLSLSLDPLTQNRYALAGGAPTSYIEVDGHGPSEDGGGGAASDPRARARGAVWTTVRTPTWSGDTHDVGYAPITRDAGKVPSRPSGGGCCGPVVSAASSITSGFISRTAENISDIPDAFSRDNPCIAGELGACLDGVAAGFQETGENVFSGDADKFGRGLADLPFLVARVKAPKAVRETRGFRPPPGTRIRPAGIPERWRIKPTTGPGGVRYYDPANPGNAVRVMPGNPNSPFPTSRAPYVRWQKNGQPLDIHGNSLPSANIPEAHIPLKDFRFDPRLFD